MNKKGHLQWERIQAATAFTSFLVPKSGLEDEQTGCLLGAANEHRARRSYTGLKRKQAIISVVASQIWLLLRGTQYRPRHVFRVEACLLEFKFSLPFLPLELHGLCTPQPLSSYLLQSLDAQKSHAPPSSIKMVLPFPPPQYKVAHRNDSIIRPLHLDGGEGGVGAEGERWEWGWCKVYSEAPPSGSSCINSFFSFSAFLKPSNGGSNHLVINQAQEVFINPNSF